jgi:hypothetical protein
MRLTTEGLWLTRGRLHGAGAGTGTLTGLTRLTLLLSHAIVQVVPLGASAGLPHALRRATTAV